MQLKHILLAAGAFGAASAQAAGASSQTSNTATQMPSASGAAAPKPSGSKQNKGPQVPADLSGGFKKDQISLKIKFVEEGKKKGKKKDKSTNSMSATDSTKMPKPTGGKGKGDKKKGHGLTLKETTKAPKYYLSKADGATAQSKWVIVMIDTTDDNKRIMHYVHSDYMMEPPKAGKDMGNATNMQQGQNQQGQGRDQAKGKGMKAVKLNSTTTPEMPWMAPGSEGDTGAKRMYTFLMYAQPGAFPAQGMPQKGQAIDMKQWVQQNGLQPAVAGKTIAVDTTTNGTQPSSAAGASPSGQAPISQVATGEASASQYQVFAAVLIGTVVTVALL